MIIYGSRATHLKTDRLRQVTCPHCQTKDQMTASVFGTHAHVFWIPLFPMGKTGVFECQHCHKGFKKKELGEDGKREYKNFLGDVKTPLWKFSGLGIIALLIAWGFYSSKMTEQKIAELVEKPAMYDKYTYRTESNGYSTFKVVEVHEDSIYVDWNDYEISKQSGIDEIDKEENYPGDIYILSKAEVKAMYDAGDIKDIDRD
jgi:hypothetical protein